jgi:hypothetical protein
MPLGNREGGTKPETRKSGDLPRNNPGLARLKQRNECTEGDS